MSQVESLYRLVLFERFLTELFQTMYKRSRNCSLHEFRKKFCGFYDVVSNNGKIKLSVSPAMLSIYVQERLDLVNLIIVEDLENFVQKSYTCERIALLYQITLSSVKSPNHSTKTIKVEKKKVKSKTQEQQSSTKNKTNNKETQNKYEQQGKIQQSIRNTTPADPRFRRLADFIILSHRQWYKKPVKKWVMRDSLSPNFNQLSRLPGPPTNMLKSEQQRLHKSWICTLLKSQKHAERAQFDIKNARIAQNGTSEKRGITESRDERRRAENRDKRRKDVNFGKNDKRRRAENRDERRKDVNFGKNDKPRRAENRDKRRKDVNFGKNDKRRRAENRDKRRKARNSFTFPNEKFVRKSQYERRVIAENCRIFRLVANAVERIKRAFHISKHHKNVEERRIKIKEVFKMIKGASWMLWYVPKKRNKKDHHHKHFQRVLRGKSMSTCNNSFHRKLNLPKFLFSNEWNEDIRPLASKIFSKT